MKNQKINWFSWFLRIALVLAFLFFVFSLFYYFGQAQRSFSRRVQNAVTRVESDLHQYQQDLIDNFDPIQLEPGIQIYIFRFDTLVYWNTNDLEPKVVRKRIPIPCDTILHFNSGDYFFSSFAHELDNVYLFTLINTSYPIENEYFVNRFQLTKGKHQIQLCDSLEANAIPILSSSNKPLAYYHFIEAGSHGFFDSTLLVISFIFLILVIYLLILYRFSNSDPSRYLVKHPNNRFIVPLLAFVFFFVVSLGVFRYLIHFGFTHGFFFPEQVSISLPLFLYFLGFLFFVTILAVLSKFFIVNNQVRLTQHPFLFSTVLMMVFCLMLVVLYNHEYNRYENENLKTVALTLADERDPEFEDSYRQFLSVAQHDTTFFSTVLSNDIMEEVAEDYIRSFLFDSVMNQYNVMLTLCDPGLELVVEPYNIVSDCMGYFQDKVEQYFGIDLGDGLAFLDDNTLDPTYLAMINILANDTTTGMSLFLEFSKPIAPPGFGLSRLLQSGSSVLPLNSSVACYQDSLLVYKFGSYIYPNYLSDFNGVPNDFSLTPKMKHYTYVVDECKDVVITVNRRGWQEKTIPFVFFFVSMMLLYLLLYFVEGQNRPDTTTLSRKFQVMIFVALGGSFFLIGLSSILYMRLVYAEKSNDVHFERTRSLLQDITMEVDFTFLKQPGFKYELDRILSRYSETFYTDINVYDLHGKLLSTTSPEIQDLHLQASLMNADAYHDMQDERSLYFNHDEQLGRATYPSAYISIMDGMGKTLAFLNTPYFSSRTGLRSEIINFVLTYINIFLLITILSSIIVVVLARGVTRPLLQLQKRMSKIDINKSNELLEWKSNDEIGDLVKQYNQLVVELEKSAAELRRNATESAWRGAARQVAHEIKNSLTPMRLSIQMLQRAADNHAEDLDQRFMRTSATLIEQIDTLSDIASSFSSYAKLPENHPESLDLVDVIGHVVTLYENEENVDMAFVYDKNTDFTMLADRTNLNSVVTNLVRNAVQAIGTKPEGRVVVSLKATDTMFVISVKDNGRGIKEEDKKMIFLPNFTTKTSGSGLGLAYTYKLVHSMDGNIFFESEEGAGAEFVVELPKN